MSGCECIMCFDREDGTHGCCESWCPKGHFDWDHPSQAIIAKRVIEEVHAPAAGVKYPLPVPIPELPGVPDVPPHASVYELTLTTDEDNVQYLIESYNKVKASKMFGVVHSYACVELTQQGLPHIHAVLFSDKKYLDASKIKGKPVNFTKRYELKRVRNIGNYLNYIRKEDGNVNIQEYCLKNQVPQFW